MAAVSHDCLRSGSCNVSFMACQSGQKRISILGREIKKIETDITIPFVPQGDMLDRWLGRAIKKNFRCYKVKVSGDVEADLKFVKAIYRRLSDALDPFEIRLDGIRAIPPHRALRYSRGSKRKGSLSNF